MTFINFRAIKLRAEKTGKCVCGKRIKRSITFSQTINPYNRDANNNLKDEQGIQKELRSKASEWKKKPVHCKAPGYWEMTSEQQKEYNNIGSIEVILSCGNKFKIMKND